ncbi:hypothetical protein HAHE_03930 [Haloferula helveola]|uniref:Lipoprotein n=1 Tax=Haloferula helveola TaxID=490095 RepID=A0ABM7RA59_9BACT|nr:hypothetical protein HAHE_03930 [Haloferula helveola]
MRLMKFLGLLSVLGLILALGSCTTSDPDLDPKPTTPQSSSSQNPWNRPISGQGGGAIGGALPNQMRR